MLALLILLLWYARNMNRSIVRNGRIEIDNERADGRRQFNQGRDEFFGFDNFGDLSWGRRRREPIGAFDYAI